MTESTAVQAWPPTRYTAPLVEDFTAAIDPWLPILELVWRAAFGYWLDPWQVALLRAITEVFPEGHPRAGQLRFRQYVVSLGRQNGKTEIAAALGLWGMLRRASAYVVGIASSREQAALVYSRALTAIRANPALAKRFTRTTDTRGITSKSGSLWELKASRNAALQGIPVDVAVCDELHIMPRELWSALIAGTGARPDTLVVGISTAGDDDSELLLDLYERIDAALLDEDARLGAAVWEAPEARWPEDDETALDWLMRANPALASGRLDPGAFLDDVKAMPETDRIRYRLNRFVQDRTKSFITGAMWLGAARRPDELLPAGQPIFTIDRTPDWGYAAITATIKHPETGVLWTELVASIPKPSIAQLVDVCSRLAVHAPATFVADSHYLKHLLAELKMRGLPTYPITLGDVASASGFIYAALARGRVRHADDPLLAQQVPRTVRKNIGDGFRVSRSDSSIEIDAAMATLLGVYVAEVFRDVGVQVF